MDEQEADRWIYSQSLTLLSSVCML